MIQVAVIAPGDQAADIVAARDPSAFHRAVLQRPVSQRTHQAAHPIGVRGIHDHLDQPQVLDRTGDARKQTHTPLRIGGQNQPTNGMPVAVKHAAKSVSKIIRPDRREGAAWIVRQVDIGDEKEGLGPIRLVLGDLPEVLCAGDLIRIIETTRPAGIAGLRPHGDRSH